MSNKIILRDFTFSCIIGIDAAEQHLPQKVLLDADISIAAAPADDATPVYNYYDAVVQLRTLAHARYGLLETLAEQAAALLLTDRAVQEVRLYCRKPKIFPDLGAAGVEIVRRR